MRCSLFGRASQGIAAQPHCLAQRDVKADAAIAFDADMRRPGRRAGLDEYDAGMKLRARRTFQFRPFEQSMLIEVVLLTKSFAAASLAPSLLISQDQTAGEINISRETQTMRKTPARDCAQSI